MPTVLQFTVPSLGAITDAALLNMRQSGGPPAAGPIFNTVAAPQLSEGQTGIRPATGTLRHGAVYTAVSHIDAATGVYTYEELWGCKTEAQLSADNALECVSAEPVNWATARTELLALGVTVYAPMRFQYYPPPTTVPAEVEKLQRVKQFDVLVQQANTPNVLAGRLLRTKDKQSGVQVDHWLLSPNYQPPSTSTTVRLKPTVAVAASVAAFVAAAPAPTASWLYVQVVFKPTSTSPIVDI